MPLFYRDTNEFAKIAIWHIAEEKNFFLKNTPFQSEVSHPHKQLQHLAGRYLLQYLYPDFPYHLIQIADTRKPFIQNEEYHFSISHSGNYAAVIMSKHYRVGIDIELLSSKAKRIKSKFLNSEELAMVAGWKLPVASELYSQPADPSVNLYTLLWCCKEAVFKWYGNSEVDFRKDIDLKGFDYLKLEGVIDCNFLKEKKTTLKLQYKIFDKVCLAWVLTSALGESRR